MDLWKVLLDIFYFNYLNEQYFIPHRIFVLGEEHNFQIYSKEQLDTQGVNYDPSSIMHYSRTAFSKNGKDTIIPIKPGTEIGQRKGLSAKDIIELNLLYDCKSKFYKKILYFCTD